MYSIALIPDANSTDMVASTDMDTVATVSDMESSSMTFTSLDSVFMKIDRHSITKMFLLAGRATFTVAIPAEFSAKHGIPKHYTFRISTPEKKDNPNERISVSFCYLLTGPDNTASYTYLGVVNRETGGVRVTGKSSYRDDSWPTKILDRVMRRLFAGEQAAIEEAGWKVMHSGRCGRCSRELTTPESVERGLGPECERIIQSGGK